MITGGSSITLLLRKRYAFWTDAPRGIVERIANNMNVEFKCDEFIALPVTEDATNVVSSLLNGKAPTKCLLHIHHIRAKE